MNTFFPFSMGDHYIQCLFLGLFTAILVKFFGVISSGNQGFDFYSKISLTICFICVFYSFLGVFSNINIVGLFCNL